MNQNLAFNMKDNTGEIQWKIYDKVVAIKKKQKLSQEPKS